jgi:hypothetical protein
LTATSVPLQREMYHTQKTGYKDLTEPVLCKRRNAWLGFGYYYWDEIEDAIRWGNDPKQEFKSYDIYISKINCLDVLDTVFNEQHYRLWLKQIEKLGNHWIKNTGNKLTLKEMNEWFRERAQWDSVTGILFQDLPQNNEYLLVINFYYRKRVQLAVFKKEIILSFDKHLHYE